MPTLYLQFQPDRVASGIDDRILAAFHGALPEAEIESGDEDGRYVNFRFKAVSVESGWSAISALFRLPEIGSAAQTACILTCEGKHGWDDYLLLHHYDRTLAIDGVPAVRPAE
jgi:hypothetical protein